MSVTLADPAAEVSYAEAAYLGLRDGLREDASAILIGPEVGAGGPFGTTRGLLEEFGPQRVVDVPAASAVAVAMGAALAGRNVIVDIAAGDLLVSGLDQLLDHAAKIERLPSGEASVAVAVRTQLTPAGEAFPLAAWLIQVPGLRVSTPAIPSDAYRLLRSAMRHGYAGVVLEDPELNGIRGLMRPPDHASAGTAKVMRGGKDVTVLATSRAVHQAVAAADRLGPTGVEVEVLDLRWLVPLPIESILASARRTGRVVVASAGRPESGPNPSIAAALQARLFGELGAPILQANTALEAGDLERAVLAAVNWPRLAGEPLRRTT